MDKLVNCKACGKEIAKGVKKCPSCGKDQRNFFGKHKIITVVGALVIVGIISSAINGGKGNGNNTTATNTSGKTTTSTQPKETIYKVGDTVKVKDGKLEYTVSKFEQKSKVGNEFLNKNASDGATLVAVQLKIKNVSDKPVGMFDYASVNLVDEKGTEYKSDIDATSYYATETNIDNSKVLSDLNPAITVNDVQVYEISKDAFAKGSWYIKVDDTKIQIK